MYHHLYCFALEKASILQFLRLEVATRVEQHFLLSDIYALTKMYPPTPHVFHFKV